MKRTVLLAVIVVAMAMMIGVQSALAVKPTKVPVTFIAKGQVTEFGVWDKTNFPGMWPRVAASGPWKVVVNVKTCHVSLTATCQVAGAVYKVSYIGLANSIAGIGTDVVTIVVPSMTVKSGGTSVTYAAEDTKITVDNSTPAPAHPLIVDIYSNLNKNVYGSINLFKAVP